jgi:hypothetical protein
VSNMASVRPPFFPSRLCACGPCFGVGGLARSSAHDPPPCPCSHSLPVRASASMLARTVRWMPHRRAHGAVCTALRVLLVCSSLAAPDAATGRWFYLHGALAWHALP